MPFFSNLIGGLSEVVMTKLARREARKTRCFKIGCLATRQGLRVCRRCAASGKKFLNPPSRK